MIEKLEKHIIGENAPGTVPLMVAPTAEQQVDKINELCDTVNKLYEEAKNNARIRANHENLIDTLVEENNVHEKQIDELQMKAEPHKCESAENGKCAKNAQDETLKCPFCQQELKIAGEHTTIMSCFNGDCKGSGLYGEKEFWQELIRTRKALGIAVDALRTVRRYTAINQFAPKSREAHIVAKKALEQITALEQKE